MGVAAEIVSGRVTNPGATITALTADSGDSFAVKSFDQAKRAWLESVWGQSATAGIVRVRSPRMHDNVQGIRIRLPAATVRSNLPTAARQPLFSQDVLSFEQSGGGAETESASMLIYYDDLPGVAARLVTYEEIYPRIANIVTVETAHTTGATLGDYSGGVALNATFDLLKANVDYALLGYEVDVQVTSVGWRGPDTGNLRIGGPGAIERIDTRDWFVQLSRQENKPFIPVINAANKAPTTVDLVHNTNAIAVNVTSILGELRAV